jgi:hypothetical protein
MNAFATSSSTSMPRRRLPRPLAGNRFQPAGEPPFGLIASDDDVVDDAPATIEDHA